MTKVRHGPVPFRYSGYIRLTPYRLNGKSNLRPNRSSTPTVYCLCLLNHPLRNFQDDSGWPKEGLLRVSVYADLNLRTIDQ